MAMASLGQAETHAPQPLQRLPSTRGMGTRPTIGVKWMAETGQPSRQL